MNKPAGSSSSSDAVGEKKQRLSPSRKVCVVCHSLGDRNDEYKIHIVDLASGGGGGGGKNVDGYTHIDPTIRLNGNFPALAFCGVDSTLYMFEGHTRSLSITDGRSASKFELSSEVLAGSNYKLEKQKLVPLRDMHHTKIAPAALPTPDGKKIVVFSTLLYSVCSANTGFELYNVADNSWEVLPGLSHRLTVSIQSYSFVSDSLFFIELSDGMFVIDLEGDVKEWKRWHHFMGAQSVPSRDGYFLTIKDGFCFTSAFAYDIRQIGGFSWGFRLPLSSFEAEVAPPPPGTLSPVDCCELEPICCPCITLLEHNDQVCDFCVLQAEMYKAKYVRLVIDVCRSDVEKYKRREEGDLDKCREEDQGKGEEMQIPAAPLDTRILKSVEFLIDVDHYAYDFSNLCLFSI